MFVFSFTDQLELVQFLTTVCDGIANPTPVNSPVADWIAVLMPTMSHFSCLSSGPPEFPGLIAASV